MIGFSGPSRRIFLAWAAGVVCAMPAVRRLGLSSRPWTPAALAELFGADEDARAVGRAYLKTRDSQVSDAELFAEIWSGVPPARRLRASRTRRTLREFFQRVIREDFEGDRTVLVEGWVLSRTEVRLCALAVLTQRGAV